MSDETAQLILRELRELRALVTGPAVRGLPEHPLTPEEFAAVCGRSAKTVRRWIAAGKLRARQDCRPWLITPVNARRFLEMGGHR